MKIEFQDALGVYPRVCGGTPPCGPRSSTVTTVGLSPRVRGNLTSASVSVAAGTTVYPRVCGGTFSIPAMGLSTQGLSARVRGNRCAESERRAYLGSIPACAGEPITLLKRFFDHLIWGLSPRVRGNQPTLSATWRRPEVYPRVCGGTIPSPCARRSNHGLSPRVRGNPSTGGSVGTSIRSIPACAGEPGTGART